MEIVVDCYGVTQRLTGGAEQVVALQPGARVQELLEALAAHWPELKAVLPRCAFAVGDVVVARTHAFAAGERVALLPPVSGG